MYTIQYETRAWVIRLFDVGNSNGWKVIMKLVWSRFPPLFPFPFSFNARLEGFCLRLPGSSSYSSFHELYFLSHSYFMLRSLIPPRAVRIPAPACNCKHCSLIFEWCHETKQNNAAWTVGCTRTREEPDVTKMEICEFLWAAFRGRLDVWLSQHSAGGTCNELSNDRMTQMLVWIEKLKDVEASKCILKQLLNSTSAQTWMHGWNFVKSPQRILTLFRR